MPRVEYWTTIHETEDGLVQKDAAIPVDDHNRVHMEYDLFTRLCKLLGFTKVGEEVR